MFSEIKKIIYIEQYRKFSSIKRELNDYISKCELSRIRNQQHSSVNNKISSRHKAYMESYKELENKNDEGFISKFVFSCKLCDLEDLEDYLENATETFSVMLMRLIDEKNLKDSEVYKNANIDRRLFSKIRSDENYLPSKKTAISFCFALKLSLDEAKVLLDAAGYSLSTSSRFDIIISYLLQIEEYNINFVNIVLEEYGEGKLSR